MEHLVDAPESVPSSSIVKRWLPLVALAGAQFVMVLDQSVMNVSISKLVDDFHTTVTVIQGVITFYCLVMAMLMLTGAKVGDIIGRRRAFAIGLVIYGCGSAMTALAPTVGILTLGWSVLEGVGAALVMPALVALLAGNFEGTSRKIAYAVVGGVAGAGIAVGPILGGWATTELSWRVVFVGEVVLVIAILAMTGFIADTKLEGRRVQLDGVGSLLSALALVTILGFSLTPYLIAVGFLLLWAFARWQQHRIDIGRDPLVHLSLLNIAPLKSGLLSLFSQNLILMGVFFTVPLYLQLVLGYNALETGIKMLPVSIAMFLASAAGSTLSRRFRVRTIVRCGLITVGVSVVLLLSTIKATLTTGTFAIAMGLLGVGMGLMASQLGNVIQSSVDKSGRGEAGGLQFTGQQLGSSLGVALVGALVLASLTNVFIRDIQSNPHISADVAAEVSMKSGTGVDFVTAPQVAAAAKEAGYDQSTTDAIVERYEAAQLRALRTGLLATAFLVLGSLLFTRELPHDDVEVSTDEDSKEKAS